MTDAEIAEIRAVMKEIDYIAHPWGDRPCEHKKPLEIVAARLAALLPREPELEDRVRVLLESADSDGNIRFHKTSYRAQELHAALARRLAEPK